MQVKPYDPESKGVAERANQFLETSFLPGRTFSSPEDINAQLGRWLPLANSRLVRRTGVRPAERIVQDKAAMLGLPPVPPVTGFAARVSLPRDYYVRMGSNDYSMHPQTISRFVDVTADLETVTINLDGRCVGNHARFWAPAWRSPIRTMSRPPGPCGKPSKTPPRTATPGAAGPG